MGPPLCSFECEGMPSIFLARGGWAHAFFCLLKESPVPLLFQSNGNQGEPCHCSVEGNAGPPPLPLSFEGRSFRLFFEGRPFCVFGRMGPCCSFKSKGKQGWTFVLSREKESRPFVCLVREGLPFAVSAVKGRGAHLFWQRSGTHDACTGVV